MLQNPEVSPNALAHPLGAGTSRFSSCPCTIEATSKTTVSRGKRAMQNQVCLVGFWWFFCFFLIFWNGQVSRLFGTLMIFLFFLTFWNGQVSRLFGILVIFLFFGGYGGSFGMVRYPGSLGFWWFKCLLLGIFWNGQISRLFRYYFWGHLLGMVRSPHRD